MKKLLLVPFCLLTVLSAGFGQHTQSLTFSSPGPITPGNPFTVSVNLMFTGYSSFGLSYWLEVDNAIAPFLSITNVQYFTFPDPNQTSPNPAPFNSTSGATSGFMNETRDLGATVNDPTMKMVPPCNCSYHIADITFMLAAGAPPQGFTLRSTTVSPRISEVTDTDFNDNNIIPAGSLSINIIPEPGTLALLGVGAASLALVGYRRSRR
jgi:hypothetical protein